MEKLYYCIESERIYTLSDLDKIRKISINDGNEYAVNTLTAFINACLVENNGSLIEIKTVKRVYSGNKLVYSESNLKTDLF